VGLHDGRVHIDQFDEAHLRDPRVLDLARRVIPHPDTALDPAWETTDKAPVDVDLWLKSGVRHHLHVDYPRGAPQNPATRTEIEDKFKAVTAPTLPESSRVRVIAAVRELERLPRIAELVDALIADPGEKMDASR
jgi:2-methylcitrate dehydratase